jgi:hypothetical protein
MGADDLYLVMYFAPVVLVGLYLASLIWGDSEA